MARTRETLIVMCMVCSAAISGMAEEDVRSGFVLDAGPTGKPAKPQPPVVDDKDLKIVRIETPCKLTESNTRYVLTRDVVASHSGFSFAAGVKNTILDLGGHTLVYDAKKPSKQADRNGLIKGQSPCGIKACGRVSHIVVRNGIVLQGEARSPYTCGIRVGGNKIEIHNMTIKVYGVMCYNIYAKWGGNNHRIHDNYMENHCRERAGGVNIGTSGILVSQAGNNWDIYNNTIVGGHRSIEVWMCGPGKGKKTVGHPLKIHHNFLSPRRIHGYKSPHGVMSYRCEGVAIYENEIQSWDSRGINTQGNHNLVHHNLIDCRYSTNAKNSKQGGYIENRCYGFWERDGSRNKIHDNVIIVHNEVTGDGSSSAMGIHASQYASGDNAVRFGEYLRNRIIVAHKDESVPALGIFTKKAGGKGGSGTGPCLIANNEILSGTVGVELNYPTSGALLKNNLFVDPKNGRWKMVAGTCSAGVTQEANREIAAPTTDAPAVPKGLKTIQRLKAVELRWQRNREKDVLGYNIYRDGKRINPFLNGARFFVDQKVESGGKHAYAIAAVNLAGKESDRSADIHVTVTLLKTEVAGLASKTENGGAAK